MLFLTAQKDCF